MQKHSARVYYALAWEGPGMDSPKYLHWTESRWEWSEEIPTHQRGISAQAATIFLNHVGKKILGVDEKYVSMVKVEQQLRIVEK